MSFGRAEPRVAALVLAGGRSTRSAPANKLLAPLADGRPMIAATVDNVLAARARGVLVVTGHDAAAIIGALGTRPIRYVHAPDYAEGLAASLRAGIAALDQTIDAALICLADMPLVTPAILDMIIAAYAPDQDREIILPRHAGQRGNPVVWGRRFFPELLALSGDTGGKQILQRHAASVAEIAIPSDAVLRDFDTPDALAALHQAG